MGSLDHEKTARLAAPTLEILANMNLKEDPAQAKD